MKTIQESPQANLIIELDYRDPIEVFSHFYDEPWNILFHSAASDNVAHLTGDFSYIAVWPYKKIEYKRSGIYLDGDLTGETDLFILLKQLGAKEEQIFIKDLPPFQGGMAGLLSYDLCEMLDNIPSAAESSPSALLAGVGFYDVVHSFDHRLKKSWLIISSKLNRQEKLQRYLDVLAQTRNELAARARISPQAPTANFSRDEYIHIVNKAIKYIHDGDIFEVNVSQQFSVPLPNECDKYDIYRSIMDINPNPFSAYIDYSCQTIISSSPERFLQVSNRHVETRPIKGTRKRGQTREQDEKLAAELINSEKDHAENIMVVDLMRNDLSQVCIPDSITVPQLCGHEVYPHVHHLVSVIHGELAQGYNAFDLLKHAFPGGSITGAPKIRAMQIIAELETAMRGPYCGSLFWADFSGSYMDSSILIRTYVIEDNFIKFNGGGAITIHSNPNDEYEETLNKIASLKKALNAL